MIDTEIEEYFNSNFNSNKLNSKSMLPNTIGEPFSTFENTNFTSFAPLVFTQPLIGHYFVELEILSQKSTQKLWEKYSEEIEDFKEAMEEYEEEMTQYEKLNLNSLKPRRPKEPQPPIEKPVYRKINLNFADKIISSWSEDFDEEHNCEVILVEFYTKSGVIGEFDVYNIRMKREDWIQLITKLGAIN